MRISIITLHAMHNPGSVYQAYALEKYLNDTGFDAEIIDYRPSYFYIEGTGLKAIVKYLIKKIVFFNRYRKRSNSFDSFTFQELEKANFISDIFIVGSDQLWNTDFLCGKDPSFYLKFVKKGKKISYSTSVGKQVIDSENVEVLKKILMSLLVSLSEKKLLRNNCRKF